MSRLAALRVAAFNPKSSVMARGASQRFRGHVEILGQQQVTALFNFDHVAVGSHLNDLLSSSLYLNESLAAFQASFCAMRGLRMLDAGICERD
jgi:hypothetical protein